MEMEAAQWVALRMSDEPFDASGFEAWLDENPRHKPLFDIMWQRVMGPGMDAALEDCGRERRARRVYVTGGLAMVLVLIAGYRTLPAAALFLAEPQDYVAAQGGIRTVRLKDGTRLTLAGGAGIKVRYTRFERNVELTHGTLFANVARDERRPFHVEAGDGEVTVLGTRFEVSMKPASVRVAVEAGHVRFGRDNWFRKPVELTANQTASLTPFGLKRTKDVTQRNGIARWRNEWVEYENAPLSRVVADLDSTAPLPIEFADKKLAELRVSGRIRLTDPLRQINNLSIIHGFSIEKTDNSIIISGD